eukprot:9562720-Prorocentrum_lima.AAC.1
MLGEVRVSAHDAIALRTSSVEKSLCVPRAAGAVAGPTSKGKGRCNKFLTDKGCITGRPCP